MLKQIIVALSIMGLISMLRADTLDVGPGKTYVTIQAAWDAAKSGDEIVVHAGTYKAWTSNRCLYVKESKSSIILRVAGDGAVICQGAFYFHRAKYKGILIEGFNFINSGRGIWLDARGDAEFASIVIRDNIIANCAYEGLYIYNKTREPRFSDILVENNTIFKSLFGVRSINMANGTANHCVFRKNIAVANIVGFARVARLDFDYSDSWNNRDDNKKKTDWPNGKGKGSESLDPRFVVTDPGSIDFLRLSATSPSKILKVKIGGFMGAVGPKGRVKREDYKVLMEKFQKGVPVVGGKAATLKGLNVTGVVYLDSNGDGKKDSGDKPLANIQVSDGESVVLTDERGAYSFKNIPGNISPSVFISVPDGFAASTPFFEKLAPNVKTVDFGLKKDPASLKDKFTFIHGADIQWNFTSNLPKWKAEYGKVAKIAEKSNSEFIVCVGDLTPFGLPKNLNAIKDEADKVDLPFHATFGGHDGIKPGHNIDSYISVFGPSAYSWNYGGVHFIVLVSETMFATPKQVARQWKWLDNDLKMTPKSTPIVVATHIPGLISAKLELIRKTHDLKAILMGHWHAHHHFVIDGVPIFCSSPWRENDWGAGTNRVRTITWDNGKITSKVVPLWGDFKSVSFGSKTTMPPRDEWPSFAGPDGARRSDVKISLPLKPVWSRKIGGIQPYFSSPAIKNGKIYLAVSDTQAGFKNSGVVCVDGGNGEVVWKTSIPSDCYSSVVLSDGKVFAANAVGQVYALSQNDGKVLWNKSMYDGTDFFNRASHHSLSKYGWRMVFAPLAASNGKVYASGINSFAAFEQNSGKKIWFHTGLGDMTYPVAGLAPGDGKLFGEDQGKVFAMKASDGTEIWKMKFQEMVGKMRRERGCSTPTFHKGNIYFVSRSRIRKISIAGKEIWNRTLSSPINYMGSAAVSDGMVVLASANRILAVNDSNGEIAWNMNSKSAADAEFPQFQEIRNGSAPAIADGKVFCGSDDGYVYILDLKTGEKLQEIKIGAPIKSSVAISADYLCVFDFNGNLHALGK